MNLFIWRDVSVKLCTTEKIRMAHIDVLVAAKLQMPQKKEKKGMITSKGEAAYYR